MKLILKLLGIVVLLLVVLVVSVTVWSSLATRSVFTTTHDAHTADFPVPFPLDEDEITAAGADHGTARRVALERAIERGSHLVNTRYMCTECHGQNLAGGVMIDAFPIGTLPGPNLTAGEGSRTRGYTVSDWDRAVRHGILPDGRASVMPSEDYQLMSDQELSDIIAYIATQPAVDNIVPPPSFGPLGKILVATGQLIPSVRRITEHYAAHPVYPPDAQVTAEFGAHLAGTCTGCHGGNLAGGPITGGDPSWPPARNLTPHPTGLADWTHDDFARAMRDGLRPDGTPLRAPMTLVTPYAGRMTEIELAALWKYLRSLPPVPSTP